MRQDPTFLEESWLARAKRLLALAQTGQHFTKDPFDNDRYEEIAHIARAMLADLGRVPVSQIDGLVPQPAVGYATPGIDIRAAIIRDGRILLVRERSDGKWAMPGGFADIGSSAAENIEREVWEEAGLRVRAKHLYALSHKARHPYPPDMRDFYKLFFLCDGFDDANPKAGMEVSDVGYFDPDALPELSEARNLMSDIRDAFRATSATNRASHFD